MNLNGDIKDLVPFSLCYPYFSGASRIKRKQRERDPFKCLRDIFAFFINGTLSGSVLLKLPRIQVLKF